MRPAKNWFGFKYFKDHEWQTNKVYKFIKYSGDYFNAEMLCPHCKLTYEKAFVSKEKLLFEGFTLDDINRFSGDEKWDAPEIKTLPIPIKKQ